MAFKPTQLTTAARAPTETKLAKQSAEELVTLEEEKMHRQVPDHDIQHLDRAVENGRKIVQEDFANDARIKKIAEKFIMHCNSIVKFRQRNKSPVYFFPQIRF